MLATVHSSAIFGVDAYLVDVEVDVAQGGAMGRFILVGLPDAAVKESADNRRLDVTMTINTLVEYGLRQIEAGQPERRNRQAG